MLHPNLEFIPIQIGIVIMLSYRNSVFMPKAPE